MPAFGPSSDAIVEATQQDKATLPFELIEVSSETLPITQKKAVEEFSAYFLNRQFLLKNQKIIPSDTLTIRIWEAADDGLFASKGQKETVFTLTVSNSGSIDMPYAGNIDVASQSVHQVREELIRRYKGKAIDPEINVEIQKTTSRSISVLGAVATPGRITVPSQGIRLYDLIALAGGIPHPSWETTIKVSDSNNTSIVGLDRIVDQADNNIVMLPGDTLYIDHKPRKFAVYGAITKPGNITINSPHPSLSALLAESGGLVDLQAEASSVFVFRIHEQQNTTAKGLPIAYRLDFSKPDVFLIAGQFDVLPSDIVYVATAGASEFRKFVTTLLTPFLGGTGGIQNLGQ